MSSIMTKTQRFRYKAPWNIPGLLIALGILLVCLLLALPAALSSNPLFMTGIISEKPFQAILYFHGKTYTFEPGDAEYDQLIEAAETTLRNENGVVEMGWSDQRFQQARSEGIALELLYAQPVKLPGSRLDLAYPSRLFFPLEVFGHEGEVIFRGARDDYWGLPIRVDTLDRIREVAEEIVNEQ